MPCVASGHTLDRAGLRGLSAASPRHLFRPSRCFENAHWHQIRPDICVHRSKRAPQTAPSVMKAQPGRPEASCLALPAAWDPLLRTRRFPSATFVPGTGACMWRGGLIPRPAGSSGGARELRATPHSSGLAANSPPQRQSHTSWQTLPSCLPPLGLSFQTFTAGTFSGLGEKLNVH